MALPSILLLLVFVGGVFVATGFSLAMAVGEPPKESQAIYAGLIGSVSELSPQPLLGCTGVVSRCRSPFAAVLERLLQSPSVSLSQSSAATSTSREISF